MSHDELTPYYYQARDFLNYNRDTGELTWRVSRRGTKGKGSIAGSTKGSGGYRLVCIAGKQMLAHRLIWFFNYGYIPTEIDHIDRCRDNNRISNLRECNGTENNLNQGLRKNNTSGYTGVYWHKADKKFISRIQFKGKTIHLGGFDCPNEAYLAYKNKKKDLLGYDVDEKL